MCTHLYIAISSSFSVLFRFSYSPSNFETDIYTTATKIFSRHSPTYGSTQSLNDVPQPNFEQDPNVVIPMQQLPSAAASIPHVN